MKKSINAWTFPDAYSFEDCFAAAKTAGFDAIEFNVDKVGRSAHSFTLETTDAQIAEVGDLARKYGIEIPSISTSLTAGLWSMTGMLFILSLCMDHIKNMRFVRT